MTKLHQNLVIHSYCHIFGQSPSLDVPFAFEATWNTLHCIFYLFVVLGMPPEIQFIVSTGNTSAESKKAQRRLVRSHVTAHRYQQKRQRDVKTFERTRKLLPSPANSLSPASVSWSENGKDEDEDEDPRSSSQLGISPFLTNDSSIYDANHDHDELRLEEDGGHLLQVYPALSPFAYIGNGIGDPFIRMYSPPSPRMSKHIFYCTHSSPSHPSKHLLTAKRCQCPDAQNASQLHH